MAQPQRTKAMQVAAMLLLAAKLRKKLAKEKRKQERAKERERLQRLLEGIEDLKADRISEAAAYAAGLLAEEEENEEEEGSEGQDMDSNQDIEESEESEETDPDERQRAQSGAEDDVDEGEGEEESPEEEKARDAADEVKDQAKEKAKQEVDKVINQAKKKLADEIKEQVAAALAKAGQAVLVFLAEWWWLILIIIVVLVAGYFIWQYYGGNTQKGIGVSGGSTPIMAYADKDQQLLDDIYSLKDAGNLVFADGTEKDLEWVTKDNVKQSQLDIRTLNTLKYIGSKWDLIRVRVARSNGPDATRRQDPLSYSVQDDSGVKAQAVATAKTKSLDTISAYSTGQALGIDQIGTFSDEMAAVPACNVTTDTPIDVGTEEIVSESQLRPIYEQLDVDGSALYTRLTILSSLKPPLPTQADYDAEKSENIYVVAQRRLSLIVDNLDQISQNGDAWGIDSRAMSEFGEASTTLRGALDYIKDKRGDELARAWQDSDKMYKPITSGIAVMWHATQSANMIGWRGSTKDGCKLWKAYEAREHVRQLVVDLMNMPADPMFAEADRPFDTSMVAAQIIVYGFEDASLDDGLPKDVFPGARVTVDDAGANFDLSAVDGKIEIQDDHFVGLPQDKGVFAKGGTIYIYRGARSSLGGSVLADLAPPPDLQKLLELWYGSDLSVPAGDTAGWMTYKKLFFIAF